MLSVKNFAPPTYPLMLKLILLLIFEYFYFSGGGGGGGSAYSTYAFGRGLPPKRTKVYKGGGGGGGGSKLPNIERTYFLNGPKRENA